VWTNLHLEPVGFFHIDLTLPRWHIMRRHR
jgi:hypothetical protein